MSGKKPMEPPGQVSVLGEHHETYIEHMSMPAPSTSGVIPQPGSVYPPAAERTHWERKHRRRRTSSPEESATKRPDQSATPTPSPTKSRSQRHTTRHYSSESLDSDVEPTHSSNHSTGYKELPSSQPDSSPSPPSFAAVTATQSPPRRLPVELPRDSEAAPTPAVTPTTPKGYPPIVVENIPDWPRHFRAIHAKLGHVPNARPFGKGIRFLPKDASEHRIVQRYLLEASAANPNIAWHCYSAANELPTKVAIRGLPTTTPIEAIKDALEQKGFTVTHVKHISGIKGRPGCVFFVALEHLNANDIARLYSLTELLYMPGISIEGWRGSGGIPQCHRCLIFGHSSINCHRPPRCVRCGEGHAAAECQRSRDATPTCANCHGPHPASYRSCPAYRREARKRGIHIPPPRPSLPAQPQAQQHPPRPTRADRRRAQQPITEPQSGERPLDVAPPTALAPPPTLAPPTNEPTPRGESLPQRKGGRGRRVKVRKNLQAPLTTTAPTTADEEEPPPPQASQTTAPAETQAPVPPRHIFQCDHCGHTGVSIIPTENAPEASVPAAVHHTTTRPKRIRRLRERQQPLLREDGTADDPVNRLLQALAVLFTAIIDGSNLREAAMRGLLHIDPDY